MFLNIKDLLNSYVVKKKILIFCPLEFFENLTFEWVPLIGFWIKIIYFILFCNFAPRGTTNNRLLLNAQNRPTLICMTPKSEFEN